MARKKPQYTLKLGRLKGLTRDGKAKALSEISEFVENQIFAHVAQGRSPVKGVTPFKALSPGYAEFKRGKVGNANADLRLTSSMLSALDAKPKGNAVKIEVAGGNSGDDDYKKAENHNNGVTLPKRQFIPHSGQAFKDKITKGVDRILAKHAKDNKK